ncbi:MAG: hypothetical protein RSG86_03230 [Oscillospiraceae bacterium]
MKEARLRHLMIALASALALSLVCLCILAFTSNRNINMLKLQVASLAAQQQGTPPPPSILLEQKCTLAALDAQQQTVTLALSALPLSVTDDSRGTFVFLTDSGDSLTFDAVRSEGGTFTAQAVLPMEGTIQQLRFTLQEGSETRSELIPLGGEVDGALRCGQLVPSLGRNGRYIEGKTWRFHAFVGVDFRGGGIYEGFDTEVYPVEAGICIYRNGVLEKTIPIPVEENPNYTGDSFYYSVDCNEQLPVSPGDEITLSAYAVDSFGRRTESVPEA